jgi:hypothetical protein
VITAVCAISGKQRCETTNPALTKMHNKTPRIEAF